MTDNTIRQYDKDFEDIIIGQIIMEMKGMIIHTTAIKKIFLAE